MTSPKISPLSPGTHYLSPKIEPRAQSRWLWWQRQYRSTHVAFNLIGIGSPQKNVPPAAISTHTRTWWVIGTNLLNASYGPPGKKLPQDLDDSRLCHHCCRWLGAEPFWEMLSHCCNTISRWHWSVPCAKGRGNDGDDDAKLTQQCQADDREKWSHVVDCGWPAVLQIDSTKLYSFRFSLNV